MRTSEGRSGTDGIRALISVYLRSLAPTVSSESAAAGPGPLAASSATVHRDCHSVAGHGRAENGDGCGHGATHFTPRRGPQAAGLRGARAPFLPLHFLPLPFPPTPPPRAPTVASHRRTECALRASRARPGPPSRRARGACDFSWPRWTRCARPRGRTGRARRGRAPVLRAGGRPYICSDVLAPRARARGPRRGTRGKWGRLWTWCYPLRPAAGPCEARAYPNSSVTDRRTDRRRRLKGRWGVSPVTGVCHK